jgi:DedD protein
MSQKTDNLIKLALVFFVSLLSFSIGTYVGKKYSDNQHKLASLEPQKIDATAANTHEFDSEKEPVETATAAAEEKLGTEPEAMVGQVSTEHAGALTDSEVAKLAEEFASDEETKTPEEPVGTIAKEEKPVGTIHAKTDLAVKKPVAAPTAPVVAAQTETRLPKKEITKEEPIATVQPTPRDEREPASLPPKQEIIPIHYTVQIGSYPTETEASDLTKSLQGKGYKTSYIPAKVNGQLWYRVNVGLFGTIKEAQDYKKEFLGKTNLSSAIIQRVQR